ncbi:MAG: hypothetical protein KJO07_18530 [Deltaproteobacteria bacterium]|nr:hypothetical protein [Deltaproteobacteria bacterium]
MGAEVFYGRRIDTSGPIVGTLNESSLHAELKRRYAQPGDAFEVPIDRFVADIARDLSGPDPRLIEIQTASFAAMGTKLDHLLPRFRITIVHPIVVRTRLDRPGRKPRLSPKKGSLHLLFGELVSMPTLLDHPNLDIDAILLDVVKVQEIDRHVRRGRGGFRTIDKRIETVHGTHRFASMDDVYDAFVPDDLPARFTTADLAAAAGVPRSVAQQMAYCFKYSCHLSENDRTREGIVYTRSR